MLWSASGSPEGTTGNDRPCRKYFKHMARHICGAPILIVRYRDVDCIMDGIHRCRQWKAMNDQSEHTACVLVVA